MMLEFMKKKTESRTVPLAPLLRDAEHMTNKALADFGQAMYVSVRVSSRNEADAYVLANRESILARMSTAAIDYSRTVLKLKQAKAQAHTNGLSAGDRKSYEKHLDGNIATLEASFRQIFKVVNPDSPRTHEYHYTQAEIANLSADQAQVKDMEEPVDMNDAASYMPSEAVCDICRRTPPRYTPAQALRRICASDYAVNGEFTSNSVLSFAVYDVFEFFKHRDTIRCAKAPDMSLLVPALESAYKYQYMINDALSFDPHFVLWSQGMDNGFQDADDDVIVRAMLVGAFYDNPMEVIKAALSLAKLTHGGSVGRRGAVIAAMCMHLANHGVSKADIREYVYGTVKDVIFCPDDALNENAMFDLGLDPDELNGLNSISEKDITTTTNVLASISEALIGFLWSGRTEDIEAFLDKVPCVKRNLGAFGMTLASVYYEEDIEDEIRHLDASEFSRFGGRPIAERLKVLDM